MGNDGQIKKTRGIEDFQLTASLVCGFDYLNYFYKIITLHELLNESVEDALTLEINSNDSEKVFDSINRGTCKTH